MLRILWASALSCGSWSEIPNRRAHQDYTTEQIGLSEWLHLRALLFWPASLHDTREGLRAACSVSHASKLAAMHEVRPNRAEDGVLSTIQQMRDARVETRLRDAMSEPTRRTNGERRPGVES